MDQTNNLFERATAPWNDSRSTPRAMLVYAHPDDEIIALGARLRRFEDALLVHITDGTPASGADQIARGIGSITDYRSARMSELECALNRAGVPELRHECLGIPSHEASLRLTGMTRALAQRMREFRPEVVFTHPYEGAHPDHEACAFAVHYAVRLLKSHDEPYPLIIESPFYHAGLHGIVTETFVPFEPEIPEVVYALSPQEQEGKRGLVDCYPSRREALSVFRFEEERFRIAPGYEFRRVPHPGPILYDDRSWGVSSLGLMKLAGEAEDALAEEMKVNAG